MSLPNNGNGFGANNASLRAFRQVNTNNSADDFHDASSHSGVSLLQTISVVIPAGTTTAGVIANIPANFVAVALSVSGVNTNVGTLTLTLTGGLAGSVVLDTAANGGRMTTVTLAAPLASSGAQVLVAPGATTGTQDLTLNITGVQA